MMARARLLLASLTTVPLFAMAAYGHFIAVPRWPAIEIGKLCGAASVVLVALLAVRLMPAWWRQACSEHMASRQYQRYARSMWPAMVAYVLILFASVFVLRQPGLPVWLRAAVAIAPVLPVAVLMRAMIRYLRELDELQRRIETEAICIAALAVPMAYFVAGFLQLARVIDVRAGTAMIWVFPLMMGSYGVAKFAVSRHYR